MKLDTWLDKIDAIRATTAFGPKVPWWDGKKKYGLYEKYENKYLGSPKYDNGIDVLFNKGYNPQEAIEMWWAFTPKTKWRKKK